MRKRQRNRETCRERDRFFGDDVLVGGRLNHLDLLQASEFRVRGSGCRVQSSGFRVQGSGFRVQGAGFRVHG